MSNPKFAETHNLVAFLEKLEESDGFEGIIDFLNVSSIRYALTVNPTIYTTCIEQFWSTAKVKTVNRECQIQAVVDKKKVIITETSIRSDLKLEDAEGTDCLPTTTIFAELERMGTKTTASNEFSSTMASAIISPEDIGKDSTGPTDSHSTPIITQPSSSKPQKKQSKRNRGRIKVLDLKKVKSSQAKEIASLKKRVKQLEKRKKSRTLGLKRLRKVGSASRVESSNDVSLERNDEEMLFDVQDDLQGEEVVTKKEVAEKKLVLLIQLLLVEEEKMKKHIEIIQDDEVAIDAIPLATKPPMIVEYKIDKEGKIGYFKLIRADGSLKRYPSMIQMLQGINREDLETLEKLVKAKHGLRRLEEDYERVL
ncbi:hypothetical protein Tco_0133667 [Tanacetum coccineum]